MIHIAAFVIHIIWMGMETERAPPRSFFYIDFENSGVQTGKNVTLCVDIIDTQYYNGGREDNRHVI